MTALMWPHEVTTWNFPSFMGQAEAEFARLTNRAHRLEMRSAFARVSRHAELHDQVARLDFAAYNGEQSELLRGKLNFSQTVRELGFCAPETVRVDQGEDRGNTLARVAGLSGTTSRLFCKPVRGARGNGIYVAASPGEAVAWIQSRGIDYLVQQCLPPTDGDWRYVLHRQPDDLQEGAPPSLRVAIERLGPAVVGDGATPVSGLIRRLRLRSRTDKMKLLLGVAQDFTPGAGERVQLGGSGNISHPKRARFPAPEALKRVDDLMADFLRALEQRLGRQLATACFDIGLNEGRVVFYEQQIRFASPYFYSLGLGAHRQNQVRRDFMRSIIASGYLARSCRIRR